MSEFVQEQAASAGDVPAGELPGQTVSVIPKEATGTAKKDENKDHKDWRRSDKEWQQMVEDAQQGKTAAQQLEKLKEALGMAKETKQEVDLVTALSQKIEALEMETARAKWERDHPSVDDSENSEKWAKIVKQKGHLVKSGDLTFDDLWAIVRKDSKPTTSKRDFREQEMNLGSVPVASKSISTGDSIDPDVRAAMLKAGYTEEQILQSA